MAHHDCSLWTIRQERARPASLTGAVATPFPLKTRGARGECMCPGRCAKGPTRLAPKCREGVNRADELLSECALTFIILAEQFSV